MISELAASLRSADDRHGLDQGVHREESEPADTAAENAARSIATARLRSTNDEPNTSPTAIARPPPGRGSWRSRSVVPTRRRRGVTRADGSRRLGLDGNTKTFPERVVANDDVDLTIRVGRSGSHGAGKSTLTNILYGLYWPGRRP